MPSWVLDSRVLKGFSRDTLIVDLASAPGGIDPAAAKEEGIEVIDTKAFAKCSKLNNVVFPKSLKVIYSDSFYSCKSLENVTFLGNTKIERDSFDDSPCQKDMYQRIFDSIDTVEYESIGFLANTESSVAFRESITCLL